MNKMFHKSRNTKIGSILLLIVILCSGLLIIVQSFLDTNTASAESTWTQSSENDFYNGTFKNTIINGTGGLARLEIDSSGDCRWIDKHLLHDHRGIQQLDLIMIWLLLPQLIKC